MPAQVSRDNASDLLPQYYSRPGQLNQEYSVDAVLALAMVPGSKIAQLRPQVPQQLFPPRYGYRQMPLTIHDVLNTDAFAPQRRQWISGPRGMPDPVRNPVITAEASPRPAMAGNPETSGASSGAAW